MGALGDRSAAHPASSGESRVTQTAGFLEVRGKVIEVVKSLIPNITIYSVDCGDVKIRFDVHSKLLRLKSGDEVVITISKDVPAYEKGVDFIAWGYVISLKHGESIFKMIISLWGFIVIAETSKQGLFSNFNFMDRVYFKVSRSSSLVST